MDIQQQQTPRPELIERASQIRAQGGSWHDCIAATGLGVYVLRCALEPGYREAIFAQQKAAAQVRQGRAKRIRPPKPPTAVPKLARKAPERACRATGHSAASVTVPKDVLFERDRVMSTTPRNLTAVLCGDPLPGRSALDRRRA